MWPLWLKGVVGVGAGALAFMFIKQKTAHAAENQGPAIVPQGVPDPTTGKTIVTLADENQAFKNVQATTSFPDTAKALYTYIKANGYDDSAQLSALVEAFQKAANTVLIGSAYRYGKLPENGVFDIVTASTLAQNTGDPLPADPSAPRPQTFAFGEPRDVNDASLTQDAIWLLKRYIKLNGDNMRDPGQMVLTRQVQVAYNTDPAYPGPGWAISAKKTGIPQTKLAEDGLLGASTKAVVYQTQSQSDYNASPFVTTGGYTS